MVYSKQVPGLYKIRYIGQTTVSSAAVWWSACDDDGCGTLASTCWHPHVCITPSHRCLGYFWAQGRCCIVARALGDDIFYHLLLVQHIPMFVGGGLFALKGVILPRVLLYVCLWRHAVLCTHGTVDV